MLDVWFNGKAVELVVLQQLETKLEGAFNLPAIQAAVLVNGKSDLIKCGSRTDDSQKLADQFASWSEKVPARRLSMTPNTGQTIKRPRLAQMYRSAHSPSRQRERLFLSNPEI